MATAGGTRAARNGRPPAAAPLPPLARGPVFGTMAVLAMLLSLTSGGYGYHRDELYFRMLDPAWGYLDQPPLTPLLVRLFSSVIADEAWAIRIPATLVMVASVLVIALVTRELGGDRRAQTLAAIGYGFAAVPLAFAHVALTGTLDLLVWPAVLLLLMRALLRGEPRWWLFAGALIGLSTYNKLLIVLLLACVALGLALVGPRSVLWSRWAVAGAGLALIIAAPNLIYQATNGFPQLAMGAALAENNADEVRVTMWPLLLVMLGPPLVPIWSAGLVALVRRPAWRPVRALAVALPALVALTFLAGSQFYYPLGLLSVVFACGCVPTAEWFTARPAWRKPLVGAGVVVNAAVAMVVGLPLLPLSTLAQTPIPGMNSAVSDQVGWPVYVDQIAAVHADLPADERSRAVVVTTNYGEAGAVDRYGPEVELPAVYSAHNQLYEQARPPASADIVVFVGAQSRTASELFGSCTEQVSLDNGVDIDNEEQGQPVAVCRDPVGGWAQVWPQLRHLD